MTVLDNARAALVQGELNAEMGVPVTWGEVRALHDVIRELIAEHERVTTETRTIDAADDPEGALTNHPIRSEGDES